MRWSVNIAVLVQIVIMIDFFIGDGVPSGIHRKHPSSTMDSYPITVELCHTVSTHKTVNYCTPTRGSDEGPGV